VAHELDDEGIQVTTLCPASVDTELFEKSEVGEAKLAEEDALNDPTSVAEAGWNGLKSGDRIVRPSMRAKLLPQVFRFLPQTKITKKAADETKRRPE
jgi:short-subunit dehydrogenase